MRVYHCNTVVVGAGAAGLNAADELKKRGVDALLVADSLAGGASQNAGSDKQTYFKLGLAGGAPDSVGDLARAFFAGGGMHGDHAYVMAALSARCFMKLALLGVPFPFNEWGEYVGYRTDHDASLRATSAGPLTSRYMAEALMASAKARGARMLDGAALMAVLTDEAGAARGLLLREADGYSLVNARYIILCTGGAALAYKNTVYPEAQRGATGAALRAGAAANNLCYWQYGLASIKVKWNVSGSYQQALPAYTDGERDFLPQNFAGAGDMLDSVFLKGYQWPFDARKLAGSSRVDAAVQALTARGTRAYMDFRREPAEGALEAIGPEAREYLANCGALLAGPLARLRAINEAAYEFYLARGLDLAREPLEVAVCAQHSNGGLLIDKWWRTTLPGLYAAGECAGAFGMYRPGGSALNETQVGSLRAAEHIAAHGGKLDPVGEEEFTASVARSLSGELAGLEKRGAAKEDEFSAEMDACAGAVRDVSAMRALKRRVDAAIEAGEGCQTAEETARRRDTLAVQAAALSSMLAQAEFAGEAGHAFAQRDIAAGAPEARNFAFETRGGVTRAVPLRSMPEGGGWFERVWRDWREGKVYE